MKGRGSRCNVSFRDGGRVVGCKRVARSFEIVRVSFEIVLAAVVQFVLVLR